MIDPANVPDVSSQEMLARFIFFSKHIRANRTLKPEAFMPPTDLELSVSRHLMASEIEIWGLGRAIADTLQLTLHGRGDILAAVCEQQGLDVDSHPLPDNPNHANVKGWPTDKPAQKNIAQEIAAASKFLDAPK